MCETGRAEETAFYKVQGARRSVTLRGTMERKTARENWNATEESVAFKVQN